MATRVMQLRYYSDNNSQNYPSKFKTWEYYCYENSFKDYRPIRQLGIQTLPGTRIFLNQSINPIIIGSSGIFEIDCNNTAAIINTFRIEQDSMKRICNDPTGYLIIDLTYGDEED